MKDPILRGNQCRDRQPPFFRLLAQADEGREQLRGLPNLDDDNLERRGKNCDALGLDSQHGHSTRPSFDDRLNRVERRTRIEPAERHVSTRRVRDRKRRQALSENLLYSPVAFADGGPWAQDDEPLPVQSPDMRKVVDARLVGHDVKVVG